MNDWNNPSGRFADADYLWGRYGAAAQSTRAFGTNLTSAIQQLADGTALIAKRYRSTEARNRLLAKQVESLLASSNSGTASDGSAYAGTDGSNSTSADPTDGRTGGTGGSGGSSDTGGNGGGSGGSTGGYSGGGGA
jgi:hypothetical protein